MLSITQAVTTSVRGTFDYKGRARRSEFWWTTLFIWAVLAAISYLNVWIAPEVSDVDARTYFEGGIKAWLLQWKHAPLSTGLYYLSLPTLLAVTARRMHDVGRRAWIGLLPIVLIEIVDLFPLDNIEVKIIMQEIHFDPLFLAYMSVAIIIVIFGLYALFLSILDSQKQSNQYGPSPKYKQLEDIFD